MYDLSFKFNVTFINIILIEINIFGQKKQKKTEKCHLKHFT